MEISADQTTALRALLAQDRAGHDQALARIAQASDWRGYNELINAALVEAVSRRFGTGYALADIIDFVAEARTRFGKPEDKFDPGAAERLIRNALGENALTGADRERHLTYAALVILGAFVADEQMNDAELDEFIAQARSVAQA